MTSCSSSDLVGLYMNWAPWIPKSQISNFLKVISCFRFFKKKFLFFAKSFQLLFFFLQICFHLIFFFKKNKRLTFRFHSYLNKTKFGGFEQQVHNGKLRVLSINTVFYHLRNKHYAKTHDPCGQQAWLRSALEQARADNARVYVVGHIPPKAVVASPSQASQFWYPLHQEPFLDLLHEFSDVIASTLWGHTHQ